MNRKILFNNKESIFKDPIFSVYLGGEPDIEGMYLDIGYCETAFTPEHGEDYDGKFGSLDKVPFWYVKGEVCRLFEMYTSEVNGLSYIYFKNQSDKRFSGNNDSPFADFNLTNIATNVTSKLSDRSGFNQLLGWWYNDGWNEGDYGKKFDFKFDPPPDGYVYPTDYNQIIQDENSYLDLTWDNTHYHPVGWILVAQHIDTKTDFYEGQRVYCKPGDKFRFRFMKTTYTAPDKVDKNPIIKGSTQGCSIVEQSGVHCLVINSLPAKAAVYSL